MRLIKKALEYFNIAKSTWNTGQEDRCSGTRGPSRATVTQPICGGSKFTVGLSEGANGMPAVKWQENQGRQGHIQSVIDIVYDNVVANLPLDTRKRVVKGFTEYKMLVNKEHVIFRSHPSYRSQSRQQRDVWYDWALFDLENIHGFDEYLRPGQVLMFIHVPFLQDKVVLNGIQLQQNQPHAVVRLFRDRPDAEFRQPKIDTQTQVENDYSMLVEFGDLNDHFHIIPCSRISEPAIVVPNFPMLPPKTPPQTARSRQKRRRMVEIINPLGEGFFVVSPRSEWSQCFSLLIRSFQEQ